MSRANHFSCASLFHLKKWSGNGGSGQTAGAATEGLELFMVTTTQFCWTCSYSFTSILIFMNSCLLRGLFLVCTPLYNPVYSHPSSSSSFTFLPLCHMKLHPIDIIAVAMLQWFAPVIKTTHSSSSVAGKRVSFLL